MNRLEQGILHSGVKSIIESASKKFSDGYGDLDDWYNYANGMKSTIIAFSQTFVALVEASAKVEKEKNKKESESDFLQKNTEQ